MRLHAPLSTLERPSRFSGRFQNLPQGPKSGQGQPPWQYPHRPCHPGRICPADTYRCGTPSAGVYPLPSRRAGARRLAPGLRAPGLAQLDAFTPTHAATRHQTPRPRLSSSPASPRSSPAPAGTRTPAAAACRASSSALPRYGASSPGSAAAPIRPARQRQGDQDQDASATAADPTPIRASRRAPARRGRFRAWRQGRMSTREPGRSSHRGGAGERIAR